MGEPKTPSRYIENINKYQKEHTRQICIRLHETYDADIIEQLGKVTKKATYIKRLIRCDMMKENKNG